MTAEKLDASFSPLPMSNRRGDLWGGFGVLKPYHVFLGMPGVGKTYTMIEEHMPLVVERGYSAIVTSQTNYAVETAAKRLPEKLLANVSCCTLHKLIFGFGGKEHADCGPTYRRPDEQFRKRVLQVGIDDAALDSYVRDAPSNRSKEVARRAKYLATLDPFDNSEIEDWVKKPAIHQSLVYDMTLLRYWQVLRKELDSRPIAPYLRGCIFVDEGQDITPLQTAVLLEVARRYGYAVRVYGDPNQQISHDYEAPLFAGVADEDLTILPGNPAFKRVPWKIAELAWSLDPTMPHWSGWANMEVEGDIRVFDKPIYPVVAGMSLSESRARTRTSAKKTRKHLYTLDPRVAHDHGWDLARNPLFCCIHGAKGWESDVVVCQRWLPNHQAKVRRGEKVALRQLFTILTRCKKTLYIHREMLALCNSELTGLARSA